MMQVVLYWKRLDWVWGFWSVTLVTTESDNNSNTLSQKKICGPWLMTDWNSSSHCPACHQAKLSDFMMHDVIFKNVPLLFRLITSDTHRRLPISIVQ
jgi:hypothetical protein